MDPNIKDRILSASAYLFGIPSLYIVLAESRKQEFLRHHGIQAFYLWLAYFSVFFALRFIIDLIWKFRYLSLLDRVEIVLVFVMGGYALYCGGRCLLGKVFNIPQ